MRLGLENITALLDSIGNPQTGVPAILVAGTNGKGSVTTFISSILREAGLRTGTFYSPHLFRINERIRIDGEEIPSPEFDRLAGELESKYGEAPFTFFEGVTAAAAMWFREKKVDAAIYEVGLGGRLDATRLADAAVTVLTGIAIDHSEHLGKTRSKILLEKLGIARRGVPLVAALPDGRLDGLASRRCGEAGVPYHSVMDEVSAWVLDMGPDGMTIELATPQKDYGIMRLKMTGRHQATNAATAVRAAELFLPGRRPGIAVVRRAMARASFAGRFQVLPGKPRIVLDVSHNEEALCASLDTLLAFSPPERNIIVFGVMARKRLGRFPARASRSAREILLVPLKEEGAARREDLVERFSAAASAGARAHAALRPTSGMAEAVRLAGRLAGQEDTVLVLGSHLAVEEAVARM